MTSKLSRERLQEIAEDGFLKHGESKELARSALAAMDSEPVAWTWHYREQWHVTNDERRAEFVATDGDVSVLPLYRHAQPAPVEVSVIDDVKTIIRILNDNDWNDTEGFRGIKTDIGKSLESWIDRIIDQIKPSGLRPDEIKNYIRETLIEKGLYDGLRLALSNAGIAAPESDEMLAVKQERYVQELVTWVSDRKPFQPAPVVPDELLKEYFRLVQCMLSDYRDGNYGDAQRWIRHIAKASDDFERKHGISPWEMARKACRAAMLKAQPQNAPQNIPEIIPGWIPVSEQMPPSRHEVLGGRWWGEKPRWCCKWATYIPGHPDAQSSGWLIPGASWTPTHWMTLPAAPQEVKDAHH